MVTGVLYFYKNHILQLIQKNNGMANFRVNYISLMVKPIHVVLIAFCGNINVVVKNQFNEDNGRILILEEMIDDTEYLTQNKSNSKLYKISLLC